MTLNLVGDDPARIGSGWFNNLSSKIIVEDSPFAQRLVAYFLILDRVLVAIRTNTPGMEIVKLFILGIVGNNLCILAAPGPQDLEHAPLPFGSLAVGRHGDEPVIEQYYGCDIGGVGRRLTCRGQNNPIRKEVGRQSGVRHAGE